MADGNFLDFQVINFRPWLVTSRKYSQLDKGHEKMMEGKEARLRYEKSMDLYNFGVALFEMMIGKSE